MHTHLQVNGELECWSREGLGKETEVDHRKTPLCWRLDERSRVGNHQLHQIQSLLPQGALGGDEIDAGVTEFENVTRFS